MASLRCEAYGYVSEIVWFKDNVQLVDASSHTITVLSGNMSAQNGGKSLTTSMVSIVTISQTTEGDAGSYTCSMDGILALQKTLVLTDKLAGLHACCCQKASLHICCRTA